MNSADKTQLLALRHAGLTFRDIGERMKLNSGNLCRVYNKIISTKSFNRTPGSGRKRKTTERDDALIVREVKKNRMNGRLDAVLTVAPTSNHNGPQESPLLANATGLGDWNGQELTSIGLLNSGEKLFGRTSPLLSFAIAESSVVGELLAKDMIRPVLQRL